MAALFDTSVVVLLLRRTPPRGAAGVIQAARIEIERGSALLPSVASAELLVGERSEEGVARLGSVLARIPTVILSSEASANAGTMGAFLAREGAPIPLPDLLIAGTAVWLGLPLLTIDGDYERSVAAAGRSDASHSGAELWRSLRLHPSSTSGPRV